jgi:hypothetical protein
MAVLIAILTIVLLGLVVLVVSAPIRAAAARASADPGEPTRAAAIAGEDARVHELETAREAKYREIRDAELDFRTGKLSQQDYAVLDGQLREEALRILDALEREGARGETKPSED